MHRILIVDDNSDDAALFTKILAHAGYSVSNLDSGKLGLKAIQENVFDLVILDLSMPDMDGLEILRAIRNLSTKPKVLVVSGFMQGKMLHAARALGASVALEKTGILDALLPTVRKLLGDAD
ncbi:MAG TPA: response regulator [Bryobacteraceae bacterium]|jgi:CheY-like chemotaxis protein